NNKNSSSILNLPRNPHARLFAADVNLDDYEDETEFDEQRSLAMMNDGIQKVDISSSLSFNIPTTQQSFDYDATIEDYSPSLDEDIEE
ncbi:18624_t:CDS:2, partial [Entrophospora sp. SA101]